VKTGKGFYEWDGFKPVKGRDFSEMTIKSSDTLLEV
jgi:3-hydroxybutyryl-CoA dehydrogenase